ncbi:MAG: hypothetical protein BGO01_03955 [Armatimonadetes bacterium 55-13]|nr:MAG: hypothetical protein BGO01_03955 [Armatimonadetes bacterium 55-13]
MSIGSTLSRMTTISSEATESRSTLRSDERRGEKIDVRLSPEDVVRKFSDDVWRFVSSKLRRREDVEDVVMEVFAIAFQNIQSLQKADSPKLWLLVVARRKAMDCLRRSYRRSELPLDLAAHATTKPENHEVKEQVRLLMERLPDLYRDVLILKYVNGLDTNEVAKIVKKSPNATNSLLQRARQSLREMGIAELPGLRAEGATSEGRESL